MRKFWPVGAALLVLAWRAASVGTLWLWRDWAAILAVYLVFAAFGRKTRAWPAVTAATLVALLAIYLSRQLPLMIDALRFSV
jgi:hypothetical protein